jgi:beta-lactamase class A
VLLGVLALAGAVTLYFGATSKSGFSIRHVFGVHQKHPALPAVKVDCAKDAAPLQSALSDIAHSFDGVVGIAVTRVGCDWVAGERKDELFPQQSVSKLWVSLGVLDAVDTGRLKLDQPIVIRPQDLAVLNQPLRQEVLDKGSVTLPVQALMTQALSHSDNLANDKLLWTIGGPDKVREMLRHKDIGGIRFGPGERLLQSKIAGMEWNPIYSLGRNFYEARAKLPMDRRKASLDAYLTDPMDGASPAGIVRAFSRLVKGELLTPESTLVMIDILSRTHSGPMRLKAGAPKDWKVYHKTGTGQELERLATGYNDVGMLQAPDGAWYAVAVMIRTTEKPIPDRMHMMQAVTRAVVHFHEPDRVLPTDEASEAPAEQD